MLRFISSLACHLYDIEYFTDSTVHVFIETFCNYLENGVECNWKHKRWNAIWTSPLGGDHQFERLF